MNILLINVTSYQKSKRISSTSEIQQYLQKSMAFHKYFIYIYSDIKFCFSSFQYFKIKCFVKIKRYY
jgi:hypothetical protein